jgi:methyl-accepting chemotaxis protein
MTELDGVIQRNSASAEELASTAEELSGQVGQLRDSVGFFKLGTRQPLTIGSRAQARMLSRAELEAASRPHDEHDKEYAA